MRGTFPGHLAGTGCGGGAEVGSTNGIVQQARQSRSEVVVVVNQQTGHSVHDRIFVTRNARGYDRCCTRCGFGQGHSPTLESRRARHYPGAAVLLHQLLLADPAQQIDSGLHPQVADQFLDGLSMVSFAHYLQPNTRHCGP